MINKSFIIYNQTRTKNSLDSFCQAPQGSILFTPAGYAQPCHYNRGYNYGKFPEQSIKEIFESRAKLLLLKKLQKYRIPESCHTCKDALKKNQFYNIGARKYDNLANGKIFPELLELQIDNTCQLECIMCSGEYSSSIRKNREHKPALSNPYNEAFVKQLTPYLKHIKRINFTGGEPFVIPLYYKIWKRVITDFPEIEMNLSTNASHIPEKFKELLPHGNFSFTISIDSMEKEMYESIRKNASYKNTMKNIEFLSNNYSDKKDAISIKSCILYKNYRDIPPLIEYWNNKNINVYAKPVWFPPYLSLRHINKKELKQVIEYYKQYNPGTNTLTRQNNSSRWEDVILELEAWYKEPDKGKIPDVKINTLEKSIAKKIKKGIQCKNKEEKLTKYMGIIKQMRNEFNSDTHYKRLLTYICYYMPTETLINEFEHGKSEAFIGRIYQSGINKDDI